MHILIAPNAFKNSLSAGEAAAAIQSGLLRSGLPCSCEIFPVGDGGDGTALLLEEKWGAAIIPSQVHDPLGRTIQAGFGWLENDRIAIIEMADASGLRLLKPDEYDPLIATSRGTGEMIRQALDKGAIKIILGIGGSATVDGGSGILQALGLRFLDSENQDLEPLPGDLNRLERIDLSLLDPRLKKTEILVLCDVRNSLLGEAGAARVFGPQKGANPEAVIRLEAGLSRLRELARSTTGIDMNALEFGGAAGGTAAGMAVFLNAKLVNGIEYFLDFTGFENSLNRADLVLTGEGSIDRQTLQGKAPFGVARRAKEKSIRVIAFAGIIPSKTDKQLARYFDELISINPGSLLPEKALGQAFQNLEESAFALGKRLA